MPVAIAAWVSSGAGLVPQRGRPAPRSEVYTTLYGAIAQMAVPPTVYETVQALGSHYLGDLYTGNHQVLPERALKRRGQPARGSRGVVGCRWGSSNVGSPGRHRASLPGLRRAFACPWGALGVPPVARVARVVWAVVTRRGGGRRVFPGGALRRCEGCVKSGALPPPAARPLGGLLGLATHVLWARMCGRRGPALSPWLACRAGGCVPRGCREAVPGGLAFHHCEGRLVSGAVPPPAAHPFGRPARVPRPVYPGRGWCGRGDPSPAPQRALLRALVARCGVWREGV